MSELLLPAPVQAQPPVLSATDEMRARVHLAEARLKGFTQLDIPVKHYFGGGVYAREMTVPAGVLLTGKIHKFEQINILSKGEVSVLLSDGWHRVRAPYTVVAPAGSKRLFYAHEESVWTVFHGTKEKDVEKIEQEFIAQTEEEYQQFQRQLGGQLCLG